MGGVASNFLPQRPAKKMLTIVPSLHAINFYKKNCAKKGTGKGKGQGESKGVDADDLCKSEPTIDTRICGITIAVTDMAGDRGEATCSVSLSYPMTTMGTLRPAVTTIGTICVTFMLNPNSATALMTRRRP